MTAQAEPRTAPRPGLVLAVLAAAGSVWAVMQSAVVPALPTLQRELDTTPTGVTWIFTGYLVCASVAAPIAGRLGDMFGKKRMLLIVLVCFGTGTLVAALATTLPVMIAARMIQGFGGAFFPLAFGIVRDVLPRERVPAGIGLISGLLGIGAGAGTLLAGPIVDSLDYHWLFWIPLAALVPTTVLTYFVIPESRVRAPGSVDVRGAVLLAGWLVALLVGITEAPSWGWTSARVAGLFAAALALFLVWIRVEARARSPLVDMRMMRLRGIWTTNLAALLLGVGMFGAFVLIPQYVQTPPAVGYGFGSSVTEAGLFLLPSSVAMVLAAPLAGRLSARYGAKPPLVAGAAITLGAYVLMALAHASSWQLYLASALLGVGVGFAFAAAPNLIVESVQIDQTGVATGMNSVMRTIGGAIGGQVGASILAASLLANGYPSDDAYTLSFALMAVAVAGGLAISLAAPGRPRRRSHRVIVTEPRVSVE